MGKHARRDRLGPPNSRVEASAPGWSASAWWNRSTGRMATPWTATRSMLAKPPALGNASARNLRSRNVEKALAPAGAAISNSRSCIQKNRRPASPGNRCRADWTQWPQPACWIDRSTRNRSRAPFSNCKAAWTRKRFRWRNRARSSAACPPSWPKSCDARPTSAFFAPKTQVSAVLHFVSQLAETRPRARLYPKITRLSAMPAPRPIGQALFSNG